MHRITIATIALALLATGFTASAQSRQAPEVNIIAPVDAPITIQRIGGGSFSDRSLALAPFTLVLTNNSTHDIIGLAVIWDGIGKPRTLISDSYTLKRPVVPAKGMIVVTPDDIGRTEAVYTDSTGRRMVGGRPDDTQDFRRVTRAFITIDTVMFDNGVVFEPDRSVYGPARNGLAATMKARPDLDAAEAKWAANKPQVYEFTYKQICFCPPPPPGTPGSEPILFRVINGTGSLIWGERPDGSHNLRGRQELEKFSTVEKQFAYIRAELDKHPWMASIDYDPDDGHPTRVHFNLEHIADADYGFFVEGFTRLTK